MAISRDGGVGAGVKEELYGGDVAVAGSVGEGGVADAVDGVDRGSDSGQPEEVGHDVRVAAFGGLAEGRGGAISRDGGVGAGVKEELYGGDVAVAGSVGEGGVADAVDGVDRGSDSGQPEEVGHDVRVAAFGGLAEGRGGAISRDGGVGARVEEELHMEVWPL